MIDVQIDLVNRSRRGERAAFEELVRQTARLLFARAYLETGDVHRAEDVVQETYLIAWKSIAQVTDASGFRAWLMSILHSVVVDSARREGRKKRSAYRVGTEQIMRLTDTGAGPEESAAMLEDRTRALAILRSLPQEYREVLMLRYLAGADYDAIARQLALSNGSLRGLLHRGMKMLREQFLKNEKTT